MVAVPMEGKRSRRSRLRQADKMILWEWEEEEYQDMKKTNIRSIRFSDGLTELIDRQAGRNFRIPQPGRPGMTAGKKRVTIGEALAYLAGASLCLRPKTKNQRRLWWAMAKKQHYMTKEERCKLEVLLAERILVSRIAWQRPDIGPGRLRPAGEKAGQTAVPGVVQEHHHR